MTIRAERKAVDGGPALAVSCGRTGGLIMHFDVRGVTCALLSIVPAIFLAGLCNDGFFFSHSGGLFFSQSE